MPGLREQVALLAQKPICCGGNQIWSQLSMKGHLKKKKLYIYKQKKGQSNFSRPVSSSRRQWYFQLSPKAVW